MLAEDIIIAPVVTEKSVATEYKKESTLLK